MSRLLSFDAALVAVYALNGFLLLAVICLLTLFAARRLFRYDPSLRYLVCLLGLICLLLTPAVVFLQNQIGFGSVILRLPLGISQPNALGVVSAEATSDRVRVDGGEGGLIRNGIAPGFWILLSVWTIGIAFGIVRLAHGWKRVRRLTADRHPWVSTAQVEMSALLEKAKGPNSPPIFISPHAPSPIAVGLFRPYVILPEGLAETLTPVQLRQVLRHEFAHIAFRHLIGGLVERMAGLLFWPHPLVHTLCRELARAREEVCDNVASQEAGAACYARTLLAMAQGSLTAPNATSALALLGPGPRLEERIAGLLHPRRNRMIHVRRVKLWAVTGVAVVAMGSCAMVRVVAAEGTPKAKQEEQKAVGIYLSKVSGGEHKVESTPRSAAKPTKARTTSDMKSYQYTVKSEEHAAKRKTVRINWTPSKKISSEWEWKRISKGRSNDADDLAKRNAEMEAQAHYKTVPFNLHGTRPAPATEAAEYAAKRNAELEASQKVKVVREKPFTSK